MERFNVNNYLFYSGKGNRPLGEQVLKILGEYLGTPLRFEYIDFGVWRDGCPNDKIPNYNNLESKHVIFFDSLFQKVAMLDFLQLAMAFRKQYGAKKLLAVIPFLLPRRCDHEEAEYQFEINYLSHYLEMMAFCGVTNMIVCTPHSEAIKRNCERLGIEFMPANMDFSRAIKTIVPGAEEISIYSPDEGSIPRAIAHAKNISNSQVIFDLKKRHKNNRAEIVSDNKLAQEIISKYSQELDYQSITYADSQDITGMNIVIIEDEMSSGETANKTAKKLRSLGAKSIYFAFTNPVCVNGWKYTLFDQSPFTRILAGDTIPRDESNRTGGKIIDVSVAEVLAMTIYRMLMEMEKS